MTALRPRRLQIRSAQGLRGQSSSMSPQLPTSNTTLPLGPFPAGRPRFHAIAGRDRVAAKAFLAAAMPFMQAGTPA